MKNVIEKFFYFMENNVISLLLMIGSLVYGIIAYVAGIIIAFVRFLGIYDIPKNTETYVLYSAIASLILFVIHYSITDYAAERYDKKYDQLHPLYDSSGQRIERL